MRGGQGISKRLFFSMRCSPLHGVNACEPPVATPWAQACKAVEQAPWHLIGVRAPSVATEAWQLEPGVLAKRVRQKEKIGGFFGWTPNEVGQIAPLVGASKYLRLASQKGKSYTKQSSPCIGHALEAILLTPKRTCIGTSCSLEK